MAALGITVLKNNVPWGPFTFEQIEDGLARGDFTVKYLAHAPGLKEWLPLGEVIDYVDRNMAPRLTPLPPIPESPVLPPVPEPITLIPAPRPPPIPVTTAPTSAKSSERPIPQLIPSSFFLRSFAFVLDCAILFIPVGLLFLLGALSIEIPAAWEKIPHQSRMEEWELLERNTRGLVWLVAVGLGWLYGAGLESSRAQATFGKRWMGMKVTDAYGERITFLHATGRYAAKYLSALPCFLGFIMALLSTRRLALHDRLASTRVVRN